MIFGGGTSRIKVHQANIGVGYGYNWSNYFIGLQGQYNNFIYKKEKTKVNIFDAYARLSLGVRL